MCKTMVKRAPAVNWKETLPEVEWLLDGGVSPRLIVDIMKLNPANLTQACRRANKPYAHLFDFRRENQ